MKKKFYIFNLLFSGAVLFAMLFQSVHSYEHLVEQLSTKKCLHEQNDNQTNITHQHKNFDNCFVCHFAFSPFKLSESYFFRIKKTTYTSNFLFICQKEISILFKGSLFALRAPPIF